MEISFYSTSTMEISFTISHSITLSKTKIESFQYNACLAITGAVRGTSKERLYMELGLESLQYCCWYRKLCYLYKIIVNKSPNYPFKVFPASNTNYNIKNTNDVPLMNIKHNFFKNTFFSVNQN